MAAYNSPLEQMVTVAQAITTSSHDDQRKPLNTHLKQVAPVTRTDEMSELVDSFRNMIQRMSSHARGCDRCDALRFIDIYVYMCVRA